MEGLSLDAEVGKALLSGEVGEIDVSLVGLAVTIGEVGEEDSSTMVGPLLEVLVGRALDSALGAAEERVVEGLALGPSLEEYVGSPVTDGGVGDVDS